MARLLLAFYELIVVVAENVDEGNGDDDESK